LACYARRPPYGRPALARLWGGEGGSCYHRGERGNRRPRRADPHDQKEWMTWIAVAFTERATGIPGARPRSCTDRRVRTAVSATPASTRTSAIGPFSTIWTIVPAIVFRALDGRPS